ncbi:hypothetical protein BJ991_000837 [Microbacterium immunditiarum]|uniref:Uncharacterized protein n=1 Tax=Microbacterium immunditiarum TaxID=337480 RepID=A0A7Y9GLU2_9MICO|nr:hypothetical protein [Microbacterium immunditiarum]
MDETLRGEHTSGDVAELIEYPFREPPQVAGFSFGGTLTA